MILNKTTFADLMPLWIILFLVAFLGLIVIVVIIVKRHTPSLQIKKDENEEEKYLQEELDRILVPIEDEKIQKEMAEASKNDAED